MGRYLIDEIEIKEDEQIIDRDNKRFTRGNVDPPKRSPIRRKDKWRQEEEGTKSKSKRKNRKIQYKIKYHWQGE